MRWHNALDDILGSTLKIRILRVLSKNAPIHTGRELARLVGYSHTQTNTALAELEMNGLVIKRHLGNANAYSLNENNLVVSRILTPAFKIEERLIQDLASRFFAAMGKDLVSTILFGSVARGEDVVGSDIDLILVVRDETDMESLDERVSEISLEAAAAFGSPISPILLTETEYGQKKRSKNPFWKTVLEEGKEITPRELEEVEIG
ncbi:MAG: winged helix-turn-helix transcriptional regulator [Actinobacteria bacterium]|jgi:predicted nucleotidyltransferase/biotin operon repressor|nr:MAG: winged helix-turn-helix transcriptional regulator [Actinomycetota bacterium]